jgi:hypothetical protein
MEVILKTKEVAAAEQWYLLPNSGSGISEIQRCMNAKTIIQQTSAEPRSFLPRLLTNALIASQVSGAMACNLDYTGAPIPGSIDWPLHMGSYANIDDEHKRASWSPSKEVSSLTVITPSVISTIIESLESSLKFTRSQLAQALGVERATLYQWFRGAEPRAKTGERLETMRQFAEEWSAAGLGSARAAWHFRVPGTRETLGALLTADHMDLRKLRLHIHHARQSPSTLELVSPKAVMQPRRKNTTAAKRRLRDLFAPTLSE